MVLKKNNNWGVTIEERRKELEEKTYTTSKSDKELEIEKRLKDKAIKTHEKFIKVTTLNNSVTTTDI